MKKFSIGLLALVAAVCMTAAPAGAAGGNTVTNISINKKATLNGDNSVTITGSFKCKSDSSGLVVIIHGAVAQGTSAQGGAQGHDCNPGTKQSFSITTNGGGFTLGKADACVSGQNGPSATAAGNNKCRRVTVIGAP